MDTPKKTTSADITASLAKGVLGAVPMIGPIVAEVVTALIPNQRLDRLERYMVALESRTNPEQLREKLKDELYLDLFEDSMRLATRALSSERIEAIAELFASGLNEDDLKYSEKKRLLSLLGQLTDQELLILKARALQHGEGREQFWKVHEAAVRKPLAHMQSSREELDKSIVFSSLELHLAELGLMKPRFKKPKRGEIPEFDDKTGQMKATGHTVTPLGRLLLRSIGAGEADES